MDDALDEDHPQVRREQLVHHGPGVHVEQAQRSDVGDLAALDVVHRDHPGAAQLGHRVRHDEPVVAAGQPAEQLQIAGLAAVVQLPGEGAAELCEQLGQPVRPPQIRTAIGGLRQRRQRGHVRADLVPDPGPLHLDHDLAAAAQRRAVHLPERGGGQRLPVEGLVGVPDRDAQVLLDDLLDLRHVERADVVLKPGQRVRVGLRQQVDASRQELAELDVGRAHRLQVGGQGLRPLGIADRRALVDQELIESRVGHQVAATVLDEQARQIDVRPEVRWRGRSHARTLPTNRPPGQECTRQLRPAFPQVL